MNAEERAWEVVKRAYGERTQTARRTAPSNAVLLGIGLAAATGDGESGDSGIIHATARSTSI